MIIGYHHTQVTAPPGSTEEIRRFYGGVLGLQEIRVPDVLKPFALIWYRLGQNELHVGIEDGVDRHKTKAHLAYEVSDPAAWRKRLADHGVELIEQPKIGGYDRFHFRDPFGNRIEIIGREGIS